MDWVTIAVGAIPALLTQAGNFGWAKRTAKKQEQLRNELLQKSNDQIQELQQKLKVESEQARVHRDMNEAFDKKAAEAWNLYHQTGIQAGNAQAMLFREIEKLVGALNEYRRKDNKEPIKVNPAVQEVVQEFKGVHNL